MLKNFRRITCFVLTGALVLTSLIVNAGVPEGATIRKAFCDGNSGVFTLTNPGSITCESAIPGVSGKEASNLVYKVSGTNSTDINTGTSNGNCYFLVPAATTSTQTMTAEYSFMLANSNSQFNNRIAYYKKSAPTSTVNANLLSCSASSGLVALGGWPGNPSDVKLCDLDLNKWYKVAVSFETSGAVKVYLNGVEYLIDTDRTAVTAMKELRIQNVVTANNYIETYFDNIVSYYAAYSDSTLEAVPTFTSSVYNISGKTIDIPPTTTVNDVIGNITTNGTLRIYSDATYGTLLSSSDQIGLTPIFVVENSTKSTLDYYERKIPKAGIVSVNGFSLDNVAFSISNIPLGTTAGELLNAITAYDDNIVNVMEGNRVVDSTEKLKTGMTVAVACEGDSTKNYSINLKIWQENFETWETMDYTTSAELAGITAESYNSGLFANNTANFADGYDCVSILYDTEREGNVLKMTSDRTVYTDKTSAFEFKTPNIGLSGIWVVDLSIKQNNYMLNNIRINYTGLYNKNPVYLTNQGSISEAGGPTGYKYKKNEWNRYTMVVDMREKTGEDKKTVTLYVNGEFISTRNLPDEEQVATGLSYMMLTCFKNLGAKSDFYYDDVSIYQVKTLEDVILSTASVQSDIYGITSVKSGYGRIKGAVGSTAETVLSNIIGNASIVDGQKQTVAGTSTVTEGMLLKVMSSDKKVVKYYTFTDKDAGEFNIKSVNPALCDYTLELDSYIPVTIVKAEYSQGGELLNTTIEEITEPKFLYYSSTADLLQNSGAKLKFIVLDSLTNLRPVNTNATLNKVVE